MANEDYDPTALRTASKHQQLEVMESWFRAMFEDPAHRTPYESKEGGYIWIWGGPYDAGEELEGEFGGIIDETVIRGLVDSLEGECVDWAPTERPGDYDEGLFDAVSENAAARRTLDEATTTIQSLMSAPIVDELGPAYRRLLFANVITALETYLSDTFINRVFSSVDLIQKYIDSDPKFKERKVPYKDILREAGRVQDEARRELLAMVWHNVAKIKPMYFQVLGVDLGDIEPVASAIQLRHDIVHRNGRRRDGAIVAVTNNDITTLLHEIDELAFRIELTIDFNIDPSTFDGLPGF